MNKFYQTKKLTASKQPRIELCLSRGAAAVIVFAGLALIATPASARWYKWVDESGNISYQDRPPPANFEESTQVLSKSGVTLQTIPSKQEQIEIDRRNKILAQKRQRDNALVEAFPTEYDLVSSRDKRVLHIDASVARMYDQLIILNTRLGSIETKINYRIERKLGVSEALESDRLAVLRSIDSTNALIKSKLSERRMVVTQFDKDLIRYRELRAGAATASFAD